MPGFSQEKLRSRRRNEFGYGSGVYTIPQEDVDKYLQNGNKNKEKLKVQLRSLLKSFMDNRNNPKKMQFIMDEIKTVKQQLQKAASNEKLRIKARKVLQKRILRVSKALEKLGEYPVLTQIDSKDMPKGGSYAYENPSDEEINNILNLVNLFGGVAYTMDTGKNKIYFVSKKPLSKKNIKTLSLTLNHDR